MTEKDKSRTALIESTKEPKKYRVIDKIESEPKPELREVAPEPTIKKIIPGQFLSDIFDHIPPGRLHKRLPGIGATTLEIEDNLRSSIIVFPTKALAATKAIKHGIYYVGSSYPGITSASFGDLILSMRNKIIIKIAVVADSLMNLIEVLGNEAYSYFHLMIDEIDTFQSESSYRSRLMDCIKVYLKFTMENRSMISATLQDFSMPELQNEHLTKIEPEGFEFDEIDTIYTDDNIQKCVTDVIIEAYRVFPDNKVLVAHNSIQGILKCIELLKDKYDEDLGVLCSEASIDRIEEKYRSKIEKGKIDKKVTFITSAYFLGIDIEEELVTIVAADNHFPNTLLSVAKIRQIFGRARRGCVKKCFIFNVNKNLYQELDNYKKYLLEISEFSIDLIKKINDKRAKKILPESIRSDLRESIIEKTVIQQNKLLHEYEGEVNIYYLNIDYLLQKQNLMNQLYIDRGTTELTLSSIYNTYHYTYTVELAKKDEEKLALAEKKYLTDIQRRLKLILYPDSQNEEVKIVPRPGIETTMHDIYQILKKSQILTFEKIRLRIQEKLEENSDKSKQWYSQELNKILLIIRIYNDGPSSELWKLINVYFKDNKKYFPSYIHESLMKLSTTSAIKNIFPTNKTQNTSVQWFRKIFKTYPDTPKGEPKRYIKTGDYWDILTYTGEES